MIRAKQPAVGLLPVLILIVPDVSEPLIDTVPPLPRTLAVIERLGDGPVKLMWFGTESTALPLKIKRVTESCETVTGPLKVAEPETDKSRMVVLP